MYVGITINYLYKNTIFVLQIDPHQMDTNLVTQILWGRTTHVGCGWTQFPLKDTDTSRFRGIYAEGEYENFFVCNYGVGGNVPGEPVYQMNCSDSISTSQKEAMEMLGMNEIILYLISEKLRASTNNITNIKNGQISFTE